MQVLAVIAAEPGLSNIELAERSGVADQGQMSKLLKRLCQLGLIENHLPGTDMQLNAWHITVLGSKLEREIRPDAAPADAVYETASGSGV